MSGKKFSVDLHLPFHQVIIMPRIIPCKVLRKVKWITKFIEKKAATEKKILTVHKLVVYDIYPKAKNILLPTVHNLNMATTKTTFTFETSVY